MRRNPGRHAAAAMVLVLAGCAALPVSSPGLVEHEAIVEGEKLTRLDPGRAVGEPESNALWYDARDLGVEGKGWSDTAQFYDRLPARAQQKVTKSVWNLSHHAAGLYVRFVTDAKQIWAIWDGGGAMMHMAATGVSGLDLYVCRDGRWVFCGSGRPKTTRTTARLANNLPGEPAEYLLYLPLYHQVSELKIGINPGAMIARAADRPKGRSLPIVFYGTSITQGGCASRTGMCHPAILGRWLDREVINLGFSGSGKMEPEMAELLGELEAAVYVIDCLPNMSADMVSERVEPFVRILRRIRPETPILLVENPRNYRTLPANRALRTTFENLNAGGIDNLHCLPGDRLLAGREHGTVDGVHPTDLGFYRMALAFEPVLKELLKRSRR